MYTTINFLCLHEITKIMFSLHAGRESDVAVLKGQ